MNELLQYWFLSGLLLAAAGWCVETVLRHRGREARWVWVTTGILTLASPLFASLWSAGAGASAPSGAASRTLPGVEILGVIPGAAGGGIDLTLLVLLAWGVVSIAMLASGVFALGRLHASARRWRTAEVLGHSVLRSGDFGPAVIGVRRPRIVLPEDLADCSEAELRMMLQHEVEHIRTRDPLLLRCAYVAAAAMPWNLALLWQVGRLRQSVEQDCDLRVIRRGTAPRPYGSLLVKMASRRAFGPQWMGAAALAEDRSGVARRLRLLGDRSGQARTTVTALLIIAGATALGVWMGIPSPIRFGDDAPAKWEVKVSPDVKVQPAIAPKVSVEFGKPTFEGEFSFGELDKVAKERADAMEQEAADRAKVLEEAEGRARGSVIRVRGNADRADAEESIDPLVYIDGVRFEGDVGTIDPDGVERVEVLKGAAAAALYGDEAAGGVVQIFLKDGVRRPGGS